MVPIVLFSYFRSPSPRFTLLFRKEAVFFLSPRMMSSILFHSRLATPGLDWPLFARSLHAILKKIIMVFIASSYHRLGTSEESSRSSFPLGRDSSSFPDSLLRDVALEKAGWKWLLLFLPLRPSSFARQECLQERTAWERERAESEREQSEGTTRWFPEAELTASVWMGALGGSRVTGDTGRLILGLLRVSDDNY